MVLDRDSAVLWDILHGNTIGADPAILSSSDIHISVKLGESPFLTQHDLLSSGELELSTAKSLDDVLVVDIFRTD